MVSGQLCSARAYFDAIDQGITQGTSGTSGAEVGAELQKALEYARSLVFDPAGLGDQSGQEPAFIHLRGARLFGVGGRPIPAGGGFWWRGRLQEISGFVWGELGEEYAQQADEPA